MFGQDYDKNHGMDNKDFPDWVGKKIEQTFHSFCYTLYYTENLICSKRIWLEENYKNRDILILGGGGSTLTFLNEVELTNFHQPWKNYKKWTLNNFYKNKQLANIPFDLISLGPEVNVQDENLLYYLDNNESDVGIELHQKWSRETKDHPLVEEVNSFYDNQNKFCFQTKYFSILGSGVRLVILACELGAKSVSFTGFDGPQAIWNANHAFEKGKNFLTYRAQGIPKDQVIKMFQDEYNWFWNYILTTYPNTKIIPLTDPNHYHEILY